MGNLKNLDHIVILKADRNSTIVVMDKDDYIKEGLRQLSSIHYTEVTDTPYQAELANRLMKTINELLELNQTKQPTDSCHRQLNRIGGGKCTYSPKVHKLLSDEISQAETHSLKSLNKTLTGRPVIAQCGSPKYYTGKLIDIFLLPIVKRQNTYIRDTPHVIRMIESLQASPNCTLYANTTARQCTQIWSSMN